jgi:hypothetical protein
MGADLIVSIIAIQSVVEFLIARLATSNRSRARGFVL